MRGMVEKREKKKRRYLGRGSGREGKHCVRKAMAAAFSSKKVSQGRRRRRRKVSHEGVDLLHLFQ